VGLEVVGGAGDAGDESGDAGSCSGGWQQIASVGEEKRSEEATWVLLCLLGLDMNIGS